MSVFSKLETFSAFICPGAVLTSMAFYSISVKRASLICKVTKILDWQLSVRPYLPLILSKLPMRQLTMSSVGSNITSFSKLPMRQLTGTIYTIILTWLDLHQLPLIGPKFDTLIKAHDDIRFQHPRKCGAHARTLLDQSSGQESPRTCGA